MTTLWTLPTIIDQYAEPEAESVHVAWDLTNEPIRNIQSLGTLKHISRSPRYDIRNKTYFIKATGFNFDNLPNSLSGIELRLTTGRHGRAMDDTIQLCIGNDMIGDNRATTEILPTKLYGGALDLWNTNQLTLSSVQNSSFGIVIRLQSHLHWPHSDPVSIDLVELRIH